MNVSIHDADAGALVLAEILPPYFTHCSKHKATKIIWLREKIVKRGVKLVNVDTVEQMGDMIAKVIPGATYEL
eukprot:CCRYP_019184-RA/>CCRYP_019184-RA protein AED:0.25 eAED:0.22 QI:0/-1/0/1/-1/0/1/0/72